jgi:hypothetical protein
MSKANFRRKLARRQAGLDRLVNCAFWAVLIFTGLAVCGSLFFPEIKDAVFGASGFAGAMLLKKRMTYISNDDLNLTGTEADNLSAKTLQTKIDRTWPLEEIIVSAEVLVDNAALTDAVTFGLLNIVKKLTLEINDGNQPRNVVNVTGPGLLIYCANAGHTLSHSTLAALAGTRKKRYETTGIYRIDYRIPFAPPQINDPLRTRCLLPVHLYPQDPVLSIQTGAAADLDGTDTDPITSLGIDVILKRREMPKAVTDQILSTGGFLNGDLIEKQQTLAGSLTDVEQRVEVPTPGEYTGLAVYHIKGGTKGTIDDISANTSVGSETRWRLEAGGVVFQDWRMKHMKAINDQSRPLTAAYVLEDVAANTNILSANFAGARGTGNGVESPSCIFLDFLTDEIHDANELGSCLDANIPANSGLKLELIGNVTTPAASTIASSINLVGHRFFGDLSAYKAIKF